MFTPSLLDLLVEKLSDVETAWSIGTFGAIAEFMRDADEAVALERRAVSISAVTARGGLRIEVPETLRLLASESLTAQSWNQRVALCLPEDVCVMNRRVVLTEIGPDGDALRRSDRPAILFDLGLGALQLDACVRTADPATVAALSHWTGRSLFESGNGAMGVILAANPHRVFVSRVGRIEVYQPIPPPNGKSPEGPHTHVLPGLLRHKRTHAATELVPAGCIPCGHFYPPHPARNALGQPHPFQADRHAAFQALLDRYGDSQVVNIKRRLIESVAAGEPPASFKMPGDRFARSTIRVALRQLHAVDGRSPTLATWLSAFDRYERDEPNDRAGDHPLHGMT